MCYVSSSVERLQISIFNFISLGWKSLFGPLKRRILTYLLSSYKCKNQNFSGPHSYASNNDSTHLLQIYFFITDKINIQFVCTDSFFQNPLTQPLKPQR